MGRLLNLRNEYQMIRGGAVAATSIGSPGAPFARALRALTTWFDADSLMLMRGSGPHLRLLMRIDETGSNLAWK
jgi:hypothetical protein